MERFKRNNSIKSSVNKNVLNENMLLKEQIKILQSTIHQMKLNSENSRKLKKMKDFSREEDLNTVVDHNTNMTSNMNSPSWKNEYTSNFDEKFMSNVNVAKSNSIKKKEVKNEDEENSNGLIFSFNINQNQNSNINTKNIKNQTSEDFYDPQGKLHINHLNNNDNKKNVMIRQKSNSNLNDKSKIIKEKNKVLNRNNSIMAIVKNDAVVKNKELVKIYGNGKNQRSKSPGQKNIITQNIHNKFINHRNNVPISVVNQRPHSNRVKNEANKSKNSILTENSNSNSINTKQIIQNQEKLINSLREELIRINTYNKGLEEELEEERKINKKFKEFASELVRFSEKQSFESSPRRSKSSLYDTEKEF